MPIILLLLLAPLVLIISAIVSFLNHGRRPAVSPRLAEATALLSALIAAFSMSVLIMRGPTTSDLLGTYGIGLSVRLDWVSSVMFLLVAFVG